MKFIADLHIHSHLARACSKDLHPEVLHRWCQLKGITVLATGDFTHPRWLGELEEKLVPAEPGLFQLKPDLARAEDVKVPETCQAPVRFLLGVEVSSIYKKGPRVRKIHNLVFTPSLEIAKKINAALGKIGNLHSDGRPILGLDSKKLLALLLDISPKAYLIPAHAWTPHFAIFGSESGFDSLEECFEDLTPHIFAIETGLSSDPPMNWRLSALDKITLISNSDAHSPEKLGREGNELEAELSYDGIFGAIKKGHPNCLKTLEFFPEEGKYHVDGHRACERRLEPAETIQRHGLCPVCQKPVTIGVLHRVEKLADRPAQSSRPSGRPGFEHIIPLKEVLAETLQVGPASVKVDRLYHELLGLFGNEFSILRHLALKKLEQRGFPLVALALERMRQGQVNIQPGYDGEYGTISLMKEEDFSPKGQLAFFEG